MECTHTVCCVRIKHTRTHACIRLHACGPICNYSVCTHVHSCAYVCVYMCMCPYRAASKRTLPSPEPLCSGTQAQKPRSLDGRAFALSSGLALGRLHTGDRGVPASPAGLGVSPGVLLAGACGRTGQCLHTSALPRALKPEKSESTQTFRPVFLPCGSVAFGRAPRPVRGSSSRTLAV